MTDNASFKTYVLDQLAGLGDFDNKNMFGGTALLENGTAFAKIKHDSLWLKVDDHNRADFTAQDMDQYSYGKDGSRKLNFYRTPADVLEEPEILRSWVQKAIQAATG